MARDETTHGNGEQAAIREVEGVLRIGMDWNGVGDEVSAPAALTARIEPGDFDDDGRRVIRVRGTMFLHGHDVKIKRRTGTDSYMIADAEALPEEYRKRAQESDAPIPLAWVPADTDVETELREQVLDAHHTANEAIVDELGATIEVTNKGESGEGEGHSIYATGAVETDDGRSLGMKWRNAADVGHQVFTENDDLEAFDAAEIDALVQFANEESPITHRMRV